MNKYGLIVSDYNLWQDYQICVGVTVPDDRGVNHTVRLPFTHQKKSWVLLPSAENNARSQFNLHGVALTQTGQELLKVIEIEPVDDYTNALRLFFRKNKLEMTELGVQG